MRLSIVKALPDAGQACDAQWTESQDVCSAKIVNIWRDPASVVEFPEMRAGFVVSGDEDGQVWSCEVAGVVLRKVAQVAIFDGARHDTQVSSISNRLLSVSFRSLSWDQ